jgi:hypothetical protein
MTFVDAIMQHFNLDPSAAQSSTIMAEADALVLSVNLRLPNDQLPAVVARMNQQPVAPVASPEPAPVEPAPAEPDPAA